MTFASSFSASVLALAASAACLLSVTGCGSSSSTGSGDGDGGAQTGSQGNGSNGTNTSGDTDGGTSSGCSCMASINGDAVTIPCGQSACAGGESFACGAQGGLSNGTTDCSSSGADSGTSTPAVLSCPKTDNSSSTTADTCDLTTQYCVLAGGESLDESNTSTITYAHCETLPKSCDDCDCVKTDAKANVEDCLMTEATECHYANGAVTLSCINAM